MREGDGRLILGEVTEEILSCAIEVHRALGPGQIESAYEAALVREMELRGVPFRRQVELPVVYKGLRLEAGYRLDLLVRDAVVVELKSVDRPEGIHEAQLITYLRLTGKRVGLLINFNVAVLRDGVLRRVI